MNLSLNRRMWLVGVGVLACAVAAGAGWQAARQQAAAAPASMAAMLPQGALLTIESPDFGALLESWNQSPEQKAWLKSDNYSVFSNSRLFGNLDAARMEFEATTKTGDGGASFNGDFLTQVAGRQSIFAWYDVGKLEFLYITRMSAGQASRVSLLKDSSAYTPRQVAGATFYMRKSGDNDAASMQGRSRTVAFAQVADAGGDLLILATREDLIANALRLIHPAAGATGDAVASEPWYVEASAALPAASPAPALHMVLNLDRLVPMPYFRSYWVQRNVSQMKDYRAAVSDLYVQPGVFREERALLLDAPETANQQADLSALAGIVPAAGVYKAAATDATDDAVTALEEKLLGRITLDTLRATEAPDPSLEVAPSGSSNDLETRIDTPAPATPAISNQALAQTLKSAGLNAMLTYSSAAAPSTSGGLWVPIHSAVVLEGTAGWNAQALAAALRQSLRGSLTSGNLGIDFRADTAGGQTIYALTGPKPLYFAVSEPGHLCLLADDRALLLSVLEQARQKAQAPGAAATRMAGFDHTSQRAPYARLTSLIDGTNQAPAAGEKPEQPAYFSQNLRSLSDAFSAMASERFVERREGSNLHQTVTYQWQKP